MGMTLTAPLPAELGVQIWERRLRAEAVLADPINGLSGVHSTDQKIDVSNEIFINLEGGKNDERFHTLVMQKTPSGVPNEGSTVNPVGTEEDLIQKVSTVYYTDVSKTVSLQEYGIEAIGKNYWQIFEQITPLLGVWAQEYDGKYMRECLLERYSANLAQAPHFLVQEFSPNIAIAGIHSSQFPAYDTVGATHVNNIGAGLVAAGVGAQACATIRFTQMTEEWCSIERFHTPVTVGGKETYIYILPAPQVRYLRDPLNAGGLGSVFRDISALTNEEMHYPNAVGRIGRMLICEDPRYPTLTLGGSAGAYSLTPQYRLAGRDVSSDPRDKTLTAKQVGFVLGKDAVCKWNPEPYHWEYEYAQYDKFAGKGIFQSIGYQQIQWDFGGANTVNPPTNATRQQDSSTACIFSAPPLLV